VQAGGKPLTLPFQQKPRHQKKASVRDHAKTGRTASRILPPIVPRYEWPAYAKTSAGELWRAHDAGDPPMPRLRRTGRPWRKPGCLTGNENSNRYRVRIEIGVSRSKQRIGTDSNRNCFRGSFEQQQSKNGKNHGQGDVPTVFCGCQKNCALSHINSQAKCGNHPLYETSPPARSKAVVLRPQ
jgi:hypothetical protein